MPPKPSSPTDKRQQIIATAKSFQREREQTYREKALKRIKDLQKQGLGYRRIAERLNAEGIPTLSGRGHWHKSTVWKLVK